MLFTGLIYSQMGSATPPLVQKTLLLESFLEDQDHVLTIIKFDLITITQFTEDFVILAERELCMDFLTIWQTYQDHVFLSIMAESKGFEPLGLFRTRLFSKQLQ